MKLELTDQEFRYLLDLVYIGNWVLNSTRGDDRIEEYDQVEGKVFSHCVPQGMPKLVERYRGSLIPSRAFADGGIHEAIEQYEDTIFYELLAEELALRDLDGQPLTRENYDALMARIDAYLSEFDEHGTDRVTAVSYTHLDVYKRQGSISTDCGRRSPPCRIFACRGCPL